MLTDSTMAPVVPRWMVEVEAAFTDAGRPTPGPDELEPLEIPSEHAAQSTQAQERAQT